MWDGLGFTLDRAGLAFDCIRVCAFDLLICAFDLLIFALDRPGIVEFDLIVGAFDLPPLI
jgi:hypothetical protein